MKEHSTEVFHINLLSQYREMIDEAVLECEFDHKTGVNSHLFEAKIKQITHAGHLDGVSDHEIHMLVEEVLFRHAQLKESA